MVVTILHILRLHAKHRKKVDEALYKWNEMNGALGHDVALHGYTGAKQSVANEMYEMYGLC